MLEAIAHFNIKLFHIIPLSHFSGSLRSKVHHSKTGILHIFLMGEGTWEFCTYLSWEGTSILNNCRREAHHLLAIIDERELFMMLDLLSLPHDPEIYAPSQATSMINSAAQECRIFGVADGATVVKLVRLN